MSIHDAVNVITDMADSDWSREALRSISMCTFVICGPGRERLCFGVALYTIDYDYDCYSCEIIIRRPHSKTYDSPPPPPHSRDRTG